MKTRILSLILTLALLLSALAGCSRTGEPSGSSAEPEETKPDYSWFSFPEETGKLIVYTNGSDFSALLAPALEIFKERYPGVEVSYQTYGEDEYRDLIRTEIPAGRGPDLVLFSSATFPDIYKTMSTDIFIDLNPYFALDGEINLSDFVEPVMDGGVLNGKRYVAPLNYDVPIILTTESILSEVGMTVDEIKTCDGFCEGAERFHEKYPDSTLYFDYVAGVFPYMHEIRSLYKNFGFQFIDFSTGQVDVDEARFRQCMDLVKLYYDPDYDVTDMSKNDVDYYYAGGGLTKRLFMYDDMNAAGYGMYLNSKTFLNMDGEEPVLFLQSNQHDGVTAEICTGAVIPQASANKANAWNLLKILLSDGIQGGHDKGNWDLSYFWSGYPVRRSSLRSALLDGTNPPPAGAELDRFIALVQSPTEALLIPQIYRRYINEEMLPYVTGEKSWDDCWKSFLNTVELYKDE